MENISFYSTYIMIESVFQEAEKYRCLNFFALLKVLFNVGDLLPKKIITAHVNCDRAIVFQASL